ncbi:MAG: hypothetical protein ABEJ80_00010 [Halarchaeum sp.]
MFDTHADTLPVWTALTLAAAATLALVLAVPASPPPDATAVANAVDAVAASDHAAARTLHVAADARVRPTRLALRNDAGTAHATLRAAVTPASTPALRRVLDGDPPSAVYDSPAAFARAARDARERARTGAKWLPTDGDLRVRRVALGGEDVTLLG